MMRKRSVIFAPKALSNEIQRFMHSYIGPSEVTGKQRGVLHYISCQERDVFQRDVEKEFNIQRSTATGILQLLEKNGMLRRESVEGDARLKKLVLTDKAIGFREKADREVERMEAILTDGIRRAELDAFFGVIDKIVDNIERHIPGAQYTQNLEDDDD